MIGSVNIFDTNNTTLENVNITITNKRDVTTTPSFVYNYKDVVSIEVSKEGYKTFTNTFLMPEYDLNIPIVLVKEYKIEPVKEWKHKVRDNKVFYWDNNLSQDNPIAFTKQVTFKTPHPVMELVNKTPTEIGAYMGYDNSLQIGSIRDRDGNSVISINGDSSITGNPSYHYDFLYCCFIVIHDYRNNINYIYATSSTYYSEFAYNVNGRKLYGRNVRYCPSLQQDEIKTSVTYGIKGNDCCCDEAKVINECDSKIINNHFITYNLFNSKEEIDHCIVKGDEISFFAKGTINNVEVTQDSIIQPIIKEIFYKVEYSTVDTTTVPVEKDVTGLYIVDNQHEITITDKKDVRVTLHDMIDSFSIETCNEVTISQQDCNLTLNNNTKATIPFTLLNLITNVEETYSIDSYESLKIPLEEGVYELNYNQVKRFIISYCGFFNCYKKGLEVLLCDNCQCDWADHKDFAILQGYYNYVLGKIQEYTYQYDVNTYVYTEVIQDLHNINSLVETANKICKNIYNCNGNFTLCQECQ